MREKPWSDAYRVDRGNFEEEKEERMIAAADDFFFKAFFYLRMNRIAGDYLEFGAGSNMRSFRLAAKYKRQDRLDDMHLYAFDSFEGLPKPQGIDSHVQWKEGAMAVNQTQFRSELSKQGIGEHEYTLIKGYYRESLAAFDLGHYGISKVAMVFVDCDLYESTSQVLQFLGPDLQPGSILAFDDWFTFAGRPDRGEQRAFYEFRDAHPDYSFVEFQCFGWHGKSFLVHRMGHGIPQPSTRSSGFDSIGQLRFFGANSQ